MSDPSFYVWLILLLDVVLLVVRIMHQSPTIRGRRRIEHTQKYKKKT